MARLFSARTLVLGGLALGAAYALKNRQEAAAIATPARPPEPFPSPAPAVANADVAGPPENTSTHVPAPEPVTHEADGGIDEAAEEAAAAAEAANIGGVPEEYPSEEDSSVAIDEAMRPVEEAGGGYAEGEELADADLVDNAEVAAGDPIDGERAIDDVIEAQDDPLSGEQLAGPDEPTLLLPLEDAPAPTGAPAADMPPPPTETPAEEKSSAVWTSDGDDAPERSETEDGA